MQGGAWEYSQGPGQPVSQQVDSYHVCQLLSNQLHKYTSLLLEKISFSFVHVEDDSINQWLVNKDMTGVCFISDYSPDTREQRLMLFQDSVLKRFGFILDRCPLTPTSNLSFADYARPQYVHCSGGMFAMIPDTKTTSPRNRDGTHRKMAPIGSHKEYIAQRWTRVESTGSAEECSTASGYYQVGFLWSWNFMLTKRWRSTSTGDESFQDKMLADFKAFCANKDNRLSEYWERCVRAYQESISQDTGDTTMQTPADSSQETPAQSEQRTEPTCNDTS